MGRPYFHYFEQSKALRDLVANCSERSALLFYFIGSCVRILKLPVNGFRRLQMSVELCGGIVQSDDEIKRFIVNGIDRFGNHRPEIDTDLPHHFYRKRMNLSL